MSQNPMPEPKMEEQMRSDISEWEPEPLPLGEHLVDYPPLPRRDDAADSEERVVVVIDLA